MNKHFFKTLVIFIVMIVVGLFGVMLASYLTDGEAVNADIEAQTIE